MSGAFRFVRQYTGPLKACILDWSGTTADKYVIAPAVVFVDVYAKHKVPISMEEARGPMGLRKDLHIKQISEMPSVRERWREVYGKYPDQGDVDAMFKDFIPLQLEALPKYTGLIPGTVDSINTIRNEFKMKIGMTTGFIKVMSDMLLRDAAKQGFVPDSCVSGDEVTTGVRPSPHMVYRNLDLLGVHPIQAVVKVDDTASGVGEALNAGCWGVGVSRWSNYMDVDSYEHEAELNEDEIQRRHEKSKETLVKTGAHYVVDSIADLPTVCEDINRRMANGERP